MKTIKHLALAVLFFFLGTTTLHLWAQENSPNTVILSEDFENLISGNGSYGGSTLTFNSGVYFVKGYTTMDANDRRIGTRSIRLRANANDTPGHEITMTFDLANGAGNVSFMYGSYSGHSGGTVYVQYSTDQGTTWNEVPNNSVTAPAWDETVGMLSATVPVNIAGTVRIRIFKAAQPGSTTINIDNLEVTAYSQTNQVAAPLFSVNSGTYYEPFQVTLSSTTADASIYYTTDGSTPDAGSTLYTTPISVSTTTTLKAIAVKTGMTNSGVSTATYTFPIQVANIAAFKAANTTTNSTVYHITGDVTFVFKAGRNTYIKDETGGLLIYDASTPIITEQYNPGDVIPGGVYGTYTLYNGLIELIPTYPTAAGTPGTPVVPLVLTMGEIINNFDTYQSQLVTIEQVTFDSGTFGTGAAGNITIHQGGNSMTCRNHFATITNYSPDPNEEYNVTGFLIPYNTSKQIAPRDTNDIQLYTPPAIPTYTITFPTLTGITFSPVAGYESPVDSLDNFAFTVTLAPSHNNSNITIKSNGVVLTPVEGVYTITSIVADQVITVEGLAINTYQIVASSGANGTITPAGTLTVNYGGNLTFNFTPDAGYMIDEVTVDNVAVGNNPQYTLNNITANHTIHVTFEAIPVNQYTVTASAGPNGTITPTGTQLVDEGDDITFTITPNQDYEIDTLFIDGAAVNPALTYTFENVTANHIIHVTFKAIPIPQYTIAASTGPNGTITPTGAQLVDEGDDITFTITPDQGYEIDTLRIDGVAVTPALTYTFANVTANHTIHVTFKAIPVIQYTITASAGPNGTVAPTGAQLVDEADDITFTATPDQSYEIDSLYIDGVAVTPVSTYTFANVTANHTIHYTFAPVVEEDFFEDFENLIDGTPAYAGATLTFGSGVYFVKGFSSLTDNNDRKIGTRSIRMRANQNDATGNEITMTFDRTNGIGDVSFRYASYGTHSGGTVYVQYSTDQGTTWNDVPNNSVTAPAWDETVGMLSATVPVNVAGTVRIRIFKAQEAASRSVNIDNLELTDFDPTTIVSTPVFSPGGGTIFAPVQVTISTATADATIYYTTDGTTPDENAALYTTPISISTTTTLKAIAVKTGMTSSGVASATYTFPTQVNTIEEFIEANNGVTSSTPYQITGDVTFVFRSGRYIYITDE
ncbi:MAG TPA: chitobiase/beta-hexosaminidase C-terminal domain-containing protein, partial [Bacteroidales bacterium]|nr:chitobiase/beta-hexosaminidase C-terminal domain-containing protein [Bacteroidales bacterium]